MGKFIFKYKLMFIWTNVFDKYKHYYYYFKKVDKVF